MDTINHILKPIKLNHGCFLTTRHYRKNASNHSKFAFFKTAYDSAANTQHFIEASNEHADLCHEHSIAAAGYIAGYFRHILTRLFILFPAAAGHFMQSEADADSLGLLNGLNISIDKIQRFNEKKSLDHPLSKTHIVSPQ